MPMDKARYPADWKKIAQTVKEKAGWICQGCGMQCRKPGEPFDTHRRTLTVHHINHTPEDCREENLIALCAGCHLRADAAHHAETRRKREVEYPAREERNVRRDAVQVDRKVEQEGRVMQTELKPCPFCGGKAMCIKRRVKMNEWIVGCDDTNGIACHGYVWKSPVYFTKKEAVNAWNRRANDGE